LYPFNFMDWLKSERRPVIICMLVHIAIFFFFFLPLSQLFYPAPGDLELFYARDMLRGNVPYRDFDCEYPPLALLSFILPALFCFTNPGYSLLLAGEMLLFDLIIICLIADAARHSGLSVNNTLLSYTLIVMAVGPIMAIRFDLLPALCVTAALWAFIKGKNVAAWAFTALGMAGKIYPIVIAPALGLYLLRHHQFKSFFAGLTAFGLTLAVTCLPLFLMSPAGFMRIVTYHSQRGIQCESTWASGLLLWAKMGGPPLDGFYDFGSWNVASPAADKLASLALPLTALVLFVMYTIYAVELVRRMPRTRYDASGIGKREARFIIGYTTVVIALFMLGNKVFSPQFLIWIMPLVPLLSPGWRGLTTLLFVVMGLLTQFIFPYKYSEYCSFATPYVLIGVLRNTLLLLLTIIFGLTNKLEEEDSLRT
jgi:hypothetical protein